MDGYLTLEEAAKLVPGGIDKVTVWRWCRRGLKSGGRVVRLKHVRFGQRTCTRAEWIEEFIAELAEANVTPRPEEAAAQAKTAARRGSAQVAQRLQEIGL